MKRKLMVFALIGSLLFAVSCKKQEVVQQEKIRPVKVIEIQELDKEQYLEYSGTVVSDEMKKLGFKNGGKIAKVFVSKGDKIKKGQSIAALDTKDLQFAVQAAGAQVNAASAQYSKALNGAEQEDIKKAELNLKKAKDAYNYTKEQYDKIERLYQEGGVTKDQLDKVKLELEIKESDVKQANEMYVQVQKGARTEDKQALASQVEQARTDYEYKASMLKDAMLTSDIEGYVVDVLYKEGEMVGAGMPIVVIRNEKEVLNVGLSNDDLGKISMGMKVKVKGNEKEVEGEVTNIAQVPDMESRTYNIEITLPKSTFVIGSLVTAQLEIGREKGIWIPITSILSSGGDYVYVVEEEIAVKRKIILGEVKGTQVQVKGLQPKEKIVIEGMKRLQEGMKVKIEE